MSIILSVSILTIRYKTIMNILVISKRVNLYKLTKFLINEAHLLKMFESPRLENHWRSDVSRRIHDRNKYGVKRAWVLFTEEYNCQKNKRLQSLFARASPSRTTSPLLHAASLPVAFSLCNCLPLFIFPPSPVVLWCPTLSLPRRWLPSNPPPPPYLLLQRTSLYCDLVEKLTRPAGQRIRNYDLSRRRDYLLSRRLWNPGRYSFCFLSVPVSSLSFLSYRLPFFLDFLAFASVALLLFTFFRIHFGCWLFLKAFFLASSPSRIRDARPLGRFSSVEFSRFPIDILSIF